MPLTIKEIKRLRPNAKPVSGEYFSTEEQPLRVVAIEWASGLAIGTKYSAIGFSECEHPALRIGNAYYDILLFELAPPQS